jgi:hypothetical protein
MKSRKHGFGLLPIRNSVGKIELILRTTDYKPTGYTVVQVLLDVEEIQGEGTLTCESIVVGGQLTDDFLNVANDKNSSC